MTDLDTAIEAGLPDRTSVPPLGAMFLMVTMLPSLMFFAAGASSLAMGAALAAILTALTAAAYPNRLRPRLRQCVLVFVSSVVLICLHLAVSSLLHPVDFARAFTSFAPLLVVIVGGCALGSAIEQASDQRIDRAASIVFWSMCLVVVMQRIGLSPQSALFVKPYFPFTEPSLFALAFMPFYIYACMSAAATRRLAYLVLGLVLIVALENLTMAVGWAVVALLCTRGFILPFLMTVILAGALISVDLSYFLDRLDFSGDSQNLSTLIWLQGWQLVREAITLTHAWGVGFQQLGVNGSNSEISRLIYLLSGTDLNMLDGGFVAVKLVGEFGIIGIVILVALLTLIGKSMIILRTAARNPATLPRATLFTHAAFVSYSLDLLVRGNGYFSGTMILLIAASQLRARAFAKYRGN